MTPVVPILPEHLRSFEQDLQARGCYAPSTVRIKVSLARVLQGIFNGTGLPLDEDAAIDQIREAQSPGRRRRSLNTTVRDLIAFYQTAGAPEVQV